ncbi:MAG: Mur ligase [Verrucomicrobia bacterium]|jgi:UDP-N-acetylmuramate: L-alanyl-gamma-D-glutamyl-meso-diaminopimelate ligase|nr:Mur ligase [Verrucomicrobiota bacterium]
MRLYFMGICGTGMGNGALLMRALGHEVTGADQNAYPPMSDRLREAGVEVLEGYDPQRLEELRPDLVVIGNVHTRGNPEVEWLLSGRAVPFVSLPELLAREILGRRRTVVVAGTHGKTTTTTLAAWLLREAGHDPGFLIGGVPLDLPVGAHAGNAAAPFVIEGDEYDSAFFDKRSKFIHYCPSVLVLNNLEFDHADIFRDLEDVRRTFRHLLKLVPANGAILANADDAEVEGLLDLDWAPVLRVGLSERADLRITDFEEGPRGAAFSLRFHGKPWGRIQWSLPGLFNARNFAMAAMAAARALGLRDPTEFPLGDPGRFRGVKCRQEVLSEGEGATILRDFAHHPTAVRETILSLRNRYPERPLHIAFEARSNTACRKIHETEFEIVFDLADRVHLGSVHRAERYPENDRIDFEGMVKRLGGKATAYTGNEELEAGLVKELGRRPEAVVVFFSNGSFDGVAERVAGRIG